MNIIEAVRQYRLFSLKVAGYHFNPGVISTVITIVFIYIMISLGFWQLDRAVFKETLQQNIEQRKNLSAVTIDELPEQVDDRRYLPIEMTGIYDTEHTFLLDNKTFNGRVGYHVFTPFKLESGVSILMSRGFVEMGRTRAELPKIVTPKGIVSLSGLLDKVPSAALILAKNSQQVDSWPVVLQYIDLTELNQMLNYELYDMVVWVNKDETSGFEYDLPVLNLNAAKNNGYAFQWFALTLALLVIYLVVNTRSLNSNKNKDTND